MTGASVRPYLRSVPLFRYLSPDTQLALGQRSVGKNLAAGQVLRLRGEQAQVLCIVTGGTVYVESHLPWGRYVPAALTAGEWAGQELVLGWERALITEIVGGVGGAEVLLLWNRDLAAIPPFRIIVPLVQALVALRTLLEDAIGLSFVLSARVWHGATSRALAHPVLAGVLLALSIGLVLLLLTVPGRALQADGYYLWLRSRSSVSAEKQVEHLSHILRLAPGHAQATVELGNISAQSGDPEKAAQYYEPVVDLHGAGANNLAVLRLEEGEPAQALEALQVAVFLEPDVASIYQNLGAAQWATGHEQESLRSFREALRVDPTLIMARYHLGLDHLHHRDLARAAAAFERILEQDMTCAPAYLGLGLVQREVGDLRRAADAFGQATLYDPSSVIARFHLGWAQMEMGRTAAAQSALAVVLERDPDRALADRVRILLAEGRSTFNALLPEREW